MSTSADTGRKRSVISVGKIVGISASVALCLALTGCPDSGGGSTSGEAPVDEAALKVEYEAEAAKEITEENADAVLESLEKEMAAESE